MAITYATITGRITQPGTDVGIRAKVTATPQTTGNMLKFGADNRITVGPQTAETDNGGILASLPIPLNSDTPGVLWKITAEPIDKIPGVPLRWTLGTFEITASADLADLVEIVGAIAPPTVTAADLADAAMASKTNDPTSAFSAALSGSIAQLAAAKWQPSTAYAAGAKVVNPDGLMVEALTSFTSGATYNAANWKTATGPDAAFAAKGQIARSPSLWRPAAPPISLVSTFQSGHGWTASGGVGSSNLNDTSDFVLGTQAAKVATVTTGPTNLNFDSPTLTAIDLTGKTIKVLLKVDGLANLNSLRLLVGDATFTNYRNFNLNANEVKTGASYIKEGEWTWVTLSYGGASQTGTGGRTAVTKFRLQANSLAGTSMTVHLGAVGYITTPTTLFPSGVVSVCFDDGRLSPYQNAKAKLDSLGWAASAFPIRDKMAGDGTSNYMSVAQLKQCRDFSGWEVGCHADTGVSHDGNGFLDLTPAQVEANLLANRQWIYDNGLGRGEGFAWPQGLFNKAVEDAAAKVCAYGRLNTTWTLETWPPQNLMRIRSASNTTSQTIMQSMVDQTKQEAGWLCLTFHEITPTGTEPLSCSTAIFNNVMDYIKTQGLTVLPMIDVLRKGTGT